MPSASTPLPLDLALQGGGSHGAFTWDVLDRLLEDDGPVLSRRSASCRQIRRKNRYAEA